MTYVAQEGAEPMRSKAIPQRGFLTIEYETRLNRAQQLMHRYEIDALWLTTEPEIRYFSGFLTQFWQSPTRPWFLVVPAKGKPIALIPEIGASYMAATWIESIRTWPSPTPADEGITLLLSTLRETAARAGRIATPMGPETHLRLPLADFDWIRRELTAAGLELIDATPITRSLRLLKSAAEIEKAAYICDLVSAAFAYLPTLIGPGDTEREIFRTFKMDILRRGSDDVPYLVGGSGFNGYRDVISPASDRTMGPSDILMLDTGSVFDGYFCDFDRNFAIGHPSDLARKAYDLLYRATEKGLQAARAGITAADLYQVMARELTTWNGSSSSVGRIGHGLGMQLTEWPSLAPFDQTVLQPGMIITLEPGLEVSPGRMMVHEENIVIRESGAELLTRRAPKELPVID
jgi:Xaa-Pro dipeptidase